MTAFHFRVILKKKSLEQYLICSGLLLKQEQSRKVSTLTQPLCRLTAPDLGPRVAAPGKPAFLASSEKSVIPLSSLPGSWFIYFKMSVPIFINFYWTFKVIKFPRGEIFKNIFSKFWEKERLIANTFPVNRITLL